jgi:hypothetical protein
MNSQEWRQYQQHFVGWLDGRQWRTYGPMHFSIVSNRYFQATNVTGVEITDRTVLIMDEVDGMSAGDRGGVAALIALIKKTKVGRYLLRKCQH